MKKGRIAITAILVFSVLGAVPVAQAAATAVPGVQAVVIVEGAGAEVGLTWFLSADDPNQDVGSLLYNVTVDEGSGYTNLGDASALTNYAAGGGLQSVSVFMGAASSKSFNITVDDGTGPVSSCIVTVDSSVDGDWDTCGSMGFTWEQIHCLGRTGEAESGFDTEANVHFDAADDEIRFQYSIGNPGHGGKALGGDTGSYEFEFAVRAPVDGATSLTRGLFSYLDSPVSKGGAGNFKTTGAYQDGVSFELEENGDTWDLIIFEHVGGTRYSRLDTNIASVDPNVQTSGLFTVNQFSGLVSFTLGAETFAVSETAFASPLGSNIHSFWLSAHAGSVSFVAPSTYYGRDPDSLCFNTIDEAFGGGSADFIAEGQPLEDFEGQGGTGGSPMFPGVDVAVAATGLGVEQTTLSYALAGFLVLGLSLIGFFVAGRLGAGAGGIIAAVASAGFNLIAYWVIVVLFLLAVTVTVLGGRR